MANLKDIKNRIKGVKSTQKITKAMKMISTARLNKAKITLGVISQYHNAMKTFLHSILGTIDTYAIESDIPLVQNIIGKSVPQKRMVVVFTTDKGLCGALNTLVLREFESSLAKNDIIYVVGKKGFDYSKSRHTIYNKHAILSAKCNFDEISEDIFTTIIKENVTDVKVIFPHFVSTMVQKPTNITLPSVEAQQVSGLFEIDECPSKLLENAVKKYIDAMLSSCLAELLCCEHSARMIAMDNATNNAKAKISMLTLVYNKTRQTNITREILEIISGSQAV